MVINLKKNSWIIPILIIAVIGIGIGLFIFFNNKNTNINTENTNNYNSTRTSSNSTNTSNSNNTTSTNIPDNTTQITINATGTPEKKEEEITKFSTKIYSKDSARQNNINITCSTLNDVTVENGTTFSFCNTVGQSTSVKGYQKADIFDKDGNKKKGLGGGNCQISTTLYNALLAVPSLVITERHEHSNKVPYIAEGKDAAVAYGSYDLKFRNDSGNAVKIKASSDGSSVTISLLKIS